MEISLVGGAVRDRLLGLPVTERDWVVVGATPEALRARGFVFHAAPGVSLEEDLRRRDLTINAIAEASDGALIDPGAASGIWSCGCCATFRQPSSRTRCGCCGWRGSPPASRPWGFRVADETRALMAEVATGGELHRLSPERIWNETVRALAAPAPRAYAARPVLYGSSLKGATAEASGKIDDLMGSIAVDAIWGVGQRLAASLQEQGITTARQLRDLDPALARQRYSVVLQRTVLELRGIACLPLEPTPLPKKHIICSRSFGQPVTALEDLREAVVVYASRAAEKLRRQQGVAQGVAVSIQSSPFQTPFYGRTANIPLVIPSADSRALARAALQGLEQIYQPGWAYIKAGVELVIQSPAAGKTDDLFTCQDARAEPLMRTLDAINARMGAGTLRFAAGGIKPTWGMRRQRLSATSTTRIADLPQAWAL